MQFSFAYTLSKVSKRRSPPSIFMASTSFAVSFFLLSTFLSIQVASKLVLEDGYTVTTVLDGHKLKINPHLVLPRLGSSDLILLDSASSVLYTVSFPITQESVIKRFSGNGVAGFSDGDVGSAQFNKPRSFAIDLKGNVYVADQSNHVIRKISVDGVITIAGGYSHSTGKKDGPAQNATFSDDFELAFVPGICALLVSDRGSQLVRQINLKEEDCIPGSKSGLGAVTIWTLGLGLSCLLGLIIGIVIRPYIIPQEGINSLYFTETWKHCQINLEKLVQKLCFGIKSAVASSFAIYALLRRLWSLILSHVILMFRINIVVSQGQRQEPTPLLDLDRFSSVEVAESNKYVDQLKDLINFDEGLLGASNKTINQGYDNKNSAVFSDCHGIDNMIQGNLGFAEATKDKILQQGSSVYNLGLVRRK